MPDLAIKPSEDMARQGGTLRVKGFSEFFEPRLDPALGDWIFICQQIFDGLVRLDSDLNIVPALAEYWNVREDGKKYIFYLRKGVRFHNGQEMTSQDVKFSLERLLRKETNSPYYQFFLTRVAGAQEFREGKADEVSGFRAPNKHIFEILWRNPYVSALSLLSMSFCKILPKDLVLSAGKNFFWKPTGTGAFKFGYWLRSPRLDIVGVRLERNNDYFGRKAYLEAFEFSPFYTIDHFLSKEVEIMPFLSDSLANAGCQVMEGGPFNITFLMMSCLTPPLDRIRIRKALSYGIDKEKLARAIFGQEYVRRTTNNFIPAKLPGFFPLDDQVSYDLSRARQILREEGYSPEKKFPDLLVFIESPKNDINYKFFRELERQFGEMGITLSPRYYKNFNELRNVGRPYLARLEWIMDIPEPENIIQPLFSSLSPFSLIVNQYGNPRLDQLLDESDVERSWTRRIDLFRRMEQILMEDVPAVPLFYDEQRVALQPYVRGAKIPALGFYYMDVRDVWLDKKE
jgi:ABC-type transport system substrate-binding protein